MTQGHRFYQNLLTQLPEDAQTDLEGLRLAFDANEDGVFDASDGRFGDFRIWQDRDQQLLAAQLTARYTNYHDLKAI